MHGTFSHHDPHEENYSSHILKLNGNDHCIGCLASKSFLVFILPLLLIIFVFPNYVFNQTLEISIFLTLWVTSLVIYGYEIVQGRSLNSNVSKLTANIYFLGSIVYVALNATWLNNRVILLLILLFSLPQLFVYGYKIFTKNEFSNPKSKLLIRTAFIIAFFFSLLNFLDAPVQHLLIILSSAYAFAKFRSFSSYRVDNTKNLFSTMNLHTTPIIGKILLKSRLFNFDGKLDLTEMSKRSRLYKSLTLPIIGVLYLIGIITIVSEYNSLTLCAVNGNEVESALLSTPFLIGRMDNPKFCENCGNNLVKNDQFCPNCGVEVLKGSQSPQQSSQSASWGAQPQRQQYQDPYRDPNRSRGQGRSGKGENRTPMIFGGVIAVLIFFITGNLLFGALMGVVAFFGVKLAQSTDNPCLSYCVMRSCCDCICQMTGQQMRRQGKF